MRRLFQLALLLTLLAGRAWGQGVVVSPAPALRNTGQYVVALPNATVTVCAAGATGIPCGPPLASTVYSDAALTQPKTNPFFADVNGNYNFAVAAGNYTVTVTAGGQGYSYQLTVQCPVNGTCTFTGSLIFSGSVSLNGGGNLSGTFTGNPILAGNVGVGGTLSVTGNANLSAMVASGPDPWADITSTAFGAVSFPFSAGFAGGLTTVTATCTATSASVTLVGSYSNFTNGMGLTLLNCGKAMSAYSPAINTPSAPTVTPSVAVQATEVGGGTSIVSVANSATGGTSYSYKIIARTPYGGHTAPSTATTISNGQAALGSFSCAVSSYSVSGTTVTVNFSGTCAAAAQYARVHLHNMSNSTFEMYANVASITGGLGTATSMTITNTGLDSAVLGQMMSQESTSATGGTATFSFSNHISWAYQTGVWSYYVCAKRGAESNYYLIGTSNPSTISVSGGNWEDLQFDDLGHTQMDSQKYPIYIEAGTDNPNSNDAICNSGTALNDPLTTTIASGGGTANITTVNAAVNNSSGNYALPDDGPALLAAANSVSPQVAHTTGTVSIPASSGANFGGGYYIINSFTVLPGKIVLKEEGNLVLNETLAFAGDTTWNGQYANNGNPSFGLGGTTASVSVNYAKPGVYFGGSNSAVALSYLTFNNAAGNGGLDVVEESCFNDHTHVNFTTSGYVDTPLIDRGNYSGGDCRTHSKDSLYSAGVPSNIPDITWVPNVLIPAAQNGSGGLQGNQSIDWLSETTNYNGRGVEQDSGGGGCGLFEFMGGTRQSGLNPVLALSNTSGNVHCFVSDILFRQDTDGSQFLMIGRSGGTVQAIVKADQTQSGNAATGGFIPLIGGDSPQLFIPMGYDSNASPRMTVTGEGYCTTYNVAASVWCANDPLALSGSRSEVFAPFGQPTGVTATIANGGSLGVYTRTFYVTALDSNGGESLLSVVSNSTTTDSSNKTVNLAWTGIAGAVGGYNIYVVGEFGSGGMLKLSASPIFGTSYSYSSANTTTSTYANISTAGLTGQSRTKMWTPTFDVTSPLQGSGVSYKSTQTFPTATANRTITWSDESGTPALLGDFAVPPAIGNTTPAAGSFTTLSASSTVSGTGFSNYFASPPALGGTTPAAVTGTSVSQTGGNSFGSNVSYSVAACETSFGITTLSGASTNTGLNCLPTNAIIDAVVYRITTTITTAVSFTVGDSGSATRYCGTQSTLTAGTTGTCTAAGYYLNPSATPVKVTPNASPGAGAMRLIVYYHTWTAPTS